jgi:peptide/nickel transport system permease protein
MNRLVESLRELARYPSAVAGLAIIVLLILLSLYAVIAIPYSKALDLWRGGAQWQMYPANARPVWVDWFTGDKLPRTQC